MALDSGYRVWGCVDDDLGPCEFRIFFMARKSNASARSWLRLDLKLQPLVQNTILSNAGYRAAPVPQPQENSQFVAISLVNQREARNTWRADVNAWTGGVVRRE